MSKTSGWEEIKRLLPIGSLVSCIVTRHEPFGVFVKINGVSFDGLVQITEFKDEGRMTVDEFPPVGSALTARVLGFKEIGDQIWLGIKPSQVDNMDRPASATGNEIRKAVPVGLRVRSDGRFEFFGIEEINSLLAKGAKVAGIEPGKAIMIKVGEDDESVKLRLGGFSVHVVIEPRAGEHTE